MRFQAKKRGNGASVHIPAPVMAATALRIDQPVDVREEAGRIIVKPLTVLSYDLDQLLAGMSPDIFAEIVDFGAEIGGEAW